MSKEKLTKAMRDAFVTLIANGNTIASVCRALDIDPSTYRHARRRYPEWAEEVDRAKEFRVQLVEDALFTSALKGNVLAQKFWLVNRSNGEWKEMKWVDATTRNTLTVENVREIGEGIAKALEELAERYVPEEKRDEFYAQLDARLAETVGGSDSGEPAVEQD